MPPNLQLFLAHAQEDKAAVRKLYAKLQAAGFKPWLDEHDLLPGQKWRDEIPKAIRASDVFIACLSPTAVEKAGYFQKELRMALVTYSERPANKIFIIPLKLMDCQAPPIHIPELGVTYTDFQWGELWKEGGFERLVKSLLTLSGVQHPESAGELAAKPHPCMGSEIILYSHFAIVDPVIMSSLGLLYDRVIHPLADWAESDNEWARQLASHCPAIQTLTKVISPLRDGDVPLCRPLTAIDSCLASGSREGCWIRFNEYVDKYRLDWNAIARKTTLDEAFSHLHSFITQTLVAEKSIEYRPVVFCWETDAGVHGNAIVEKLATLFDLALRDFAVGSVCVSPQHFQQVRKIVADCPAREQYRSQLFNFAQKTLNEMKAESDLTEKKAIVRKNLQELKASYEQWLGMLKLLEHSGLVRISDHADLNMVQVAKSIVTFKKFSVKGTLLGLLGVGLQAQHQSLAATLFSNEDLRAVVGHVTWQHHLLSFSARTKEMIVSEAASRSTPAVGGADLSEEGRGGA